MYILTKIEHAVLKSIHTHLADRGIDPIMTPVRIDMLQCSLDESQIEVVINAMVVFKYVTKICGYVALTEKGSEVLENAKLFGSNGQNQEKGLHLPEKDSQ